MFISNSQSDIELQQDIRNIRRIPIVPALLDVICRTTGMGFAAIARVTQARWIACEVHDEINFGLVSGGELQIESTICNEIMSHRNPVVIDHVDKSEQYAAHHTPLKYGFQSYISVPIIKQNGEFFGTLCAIDPKPAVLDNPKTLGMFKLFAELISFHLDSQETIEQGKAAVQELSKQLNESIDENRQYQYISNHNLQEPLRKLRVFTDILITAVDNKQAEQAKELALKINFSAQRFSMMIQDLADYKHLNEQDASFQMLDLNKVIADVCSHLKAQLDVNHATVHTDKFPPVYGNTLQLEQLFYRLISNAIKYAKKDVPLRVSITRAMPDATPPLNGPDYSASQYLDIRLADNGVGIEKLHLEKIFDLFSRGNYDEIKVGGGVGLAYCRRIVRNHKGVITAQSAYGEGTTFSILLPLEQL